MGIFTFLPTATLPEEHPAGPALRAAATSLASCSDLPEDHDSFGVSGFRGYQIAPCDSLNPVLQAGLQLWWVGAAWAKAAAQEGAESQPARSL